MTLDLDPIIKRADQLWRDIGNLTLAEARTSPLPLLFRDISELVARIRELETPPTNSVLDSIMAIARDLPGHDIDELTLYAKYLQTKRSGGYL